MSKKGVDQQQSGKTLKIVEVEGNREREKEKKGTLSAPTSQDLRVEPEGGAIVAGKSESLNKPIQLTDYPKNKLREFEAMGKKVQRGNWKWPILKFRRAIGGGGKKRAREEKNHGQEKITESIILVSKRSSKKGKGGGRKRARKIREGNGKKTRADGGRACDSGRGTEGR